MWLFVSKENSGFLPHVFSSALSSSLAPSGTDMSGTFGTSSINFCHFFKISFSSSSFCFRCSLRTRISLMSVSRSVATFMPATLSEILFCSARRFSTSERVSKRVSSICNSPSTSNLMCFLRAASLMRSAFSFMNFISSIVGS